MALGGGCHGEIGIHVGYSGIDGCFERGVVPPGIVVECHQMTGTHQAGEGKRMVHRAVAPADVPGVLGGGVLRVVQQQIDLLGELEAGGLLRIDGKSVRPEHGSWSGR